MVYIDGRYSVTNTPGIPIPANLLTGPRVPIRLTLEQAKEANAIYQGNGLICQQKMCESMTGSNDVGKCSLNNNWQDIVNFCGNSQTTSMYHNGALYTLQPPMGNPPPINWNGMY